MNDVLPCPHCTSILRRPPQLVAGDAVQCPRCGLEFRVLEEDAAHPGAGHDPTGEDRIQERPTPPRPAFEPDEDAMPSLRLMAGGRVEIGQWLAVARARWSTFGGPFIGYFFLAYAILAILCVLTILVPPVGVLALACLQPALMHGASFAALRAVRGERGSFRDFFGGFERWASLLWMHVLLMLLVGIALSPSLAGGAALAFALESALPPPLTVVVALAIALYLLGLAILLYLFTRLGFAPLFLLDRKMVVTEALIASWRMTASKVFGLMGFHLLLGLILLGGYMLCCVGLLFALPLTVLAHATAYASLAGASPSLYLHSGTHVAQEPSP